jgi:hypothetical protein
MLIRKLTAIGAAQKPFANRKSCAGMSSPRGEETGEGELNPDLPYRSAKPGPCRSQTFPFDAPFIRVHLCLSVVKISVYSVPGFRRFPGRLGKLNQIKPGWTKLRLL